MAGRDARRDAIETAIREADRTIQRLEDLIGELEDADADSEGKADAGFEQAADLLTRVGAWMVGRPDRWIQDDVREWCRINDTFAVVPMTGWQAAS